MKTERDFRQSGILDPIPSSNGMDIFSIIQQYEQEGREILKANGYPLALREMVYSRFDDNMNRLRAKPLPRRIRDVMNMLAYFQTVRFYIKKNVVSDALCFMAYGVQAAMKARIRPVERLIEIGTSTSKKEKQRRSKRQTWGGQTREQLAERNQKIVDHFNRTKLTVSGFAQKHAGKYGLSIRTIRLILSKTVGSLPG